MQRNNKNNRIRVIYAPIHNKAYTLKDLTGQPFLNVYRKKIKKEKVTNNYE